MRALVNGRGDGCHAFAQSGNLASARHRDAEKANSFCPPDGVMQARKAVAGSSATLSMCVRIAGLKTDARDVFASLAQRNFNAALKTVLPMCSESLSVAGALLTGLLTGVVSSVVASGNGTKASLWSAL